MIFLALSARCALVKEVRHISSILNAIVGRPKPVSAAAAFAATPLRRGCAAGLVVALLLAHGTARADVPVNGRQQDFDFPGEQVRAIAARDYARRIESYRRSGTLDRDARMLARVRRVMGALVAQGVALKPAASVWGWEVHVVESTLFDAFSMAGGKILVSGPFVRTHELTDGELAALLAHEVAHALAEHVREQLTAVHRLDSAYRGLGVEDVTALLEWDLSVTLKLAELSRLHELEADDIGIYLAANAGFNPRALVRFYRKLGSVDRGEHFVDTHGPVESRMRTVKNFAAYAQVLYQERASPRRASDIQPQ